MTEKKPSSESSAEFRCTRCGECCKIGYAVGLYRPDIEKFAEIMSYEEMVRTAVIPVDFLNHLPQFTLYFNNDDSCIFYDDDTGCKIYDHRPLACRAFPIDVVAGFCLNSNAEPTREMRDAAEQIIQEQFVMHLRGPDLYYPWELLQAYTELQDKDPLLWEKKTQRTRHALQKYGPEAKSIHHKEISQEARNLSPVISHWLSKMGVMR